MKIIKKNKIDRELRNAKKNSNKLEKLSSFHYDDLILNLFLIVFSFMVLGVFFAFIAANFYLLTPSILGAIFVFLFDNSPFFLRYKKHCKEYSKINQKIKKLEKESACLEVEDNYQEYFSELIKLKGSKELEKINSKLIQDIIETYRIKDQLNLPKFRNEDRIDHFLKNELNNSQLVNNKNIALLKIETN